MKSLERNRQLDIDKHNSCLAGFGAQITDQFIYYWEKSQLFTSFTVDNVNQRIYIFKSNSPIIKISYSSITGCEIKTDDEVTGGVGRAVIGGVLAGGVGAIVGATTAKKRIKSYKIVIYLKDIEMPCVKINLIKNAKTNSLNYIRATKFAEQVNAAIKAIISLYEENDNVPSSVADELLKLKSLLDSGLLTENEFAELKQRIIKE